MRNRVAGVRGLVRMCVVLVVAPAMVVMAGQVANASTADNVAVSSMPFPVGPVGIAFVVLGFGGLVLGLVRHRRRVVAPRVVERTPEPVVTEQHAA